MFLVAMTRLFQTPVLRFQSLAVVVVVVVVKLHQQFIHEFTHA
jgi:hypothetical protein